jgi:hypothetical protein
VQRGLPPALALFRAISKAEMLAIDTELRGIYLNGLAVDRIDMWWWSGRIWERIANPAICRDMPDGAVFGSCTYCGQPAAWLDGNRHCYGYGVSRRIEQIHCCPDLCPIEHEAVTGCFYWAAQRACATR